MEDRSGGMVWWVLKSNIFGQESTYHKGKKLKEFLRGMSVRQKLGLILKNKVVRKLMLEMVFCYKNCEKKLF